eukprot:8019175-Pyramimonas_sp.AAC.1
MMTSHRDLEERLQHLLGNDSPHLNGNLQRVPSWMNLTALGSLLWSAPVSYTHLRAHETGAYL